MRSAGGAWIAAALDLVWPRRCAWCDRSAAPEEVFEGAYCRLCWSRVPATPLPANHCPVCAGPSGGPRGEGCRDCTRRPPPFDTVVAAGLYGQASPLLRDAILRLKHRRDHRQARPLARLMVEPLRELDLGPCWLVPVPLHPRRQRRRGFNQAVLLGRELAQELPRATLVEALCRVRPTAPQGRSAEDRRRNMAKAFGLSPLAARAPAGWAAVLVDDVMTTGATVEGCAALLRRTGLDPIVVAVTARAWPPGSATAPGAGGDHRAERY